MDSNSEETESNEEETTPNEEIKPPEELWDEIGFHRPLGGFWFRVIFILITAIFGLAAYYKYIYHIMNLSVIER